MTPVDRRLEHPSGHVQGPKSLAHRLAENLKRHRGDQPQAVFARKLGLAQATLARVERGKQNITLATLDRLCRRLRCDVGELFSEPERS